MARHKNPNWIIGIVGHKGAGKDTVAQLIRGAYYDALASHVFSPARAPERVAFADPLKDAVRVIFGIPMSVLHGGQDEKERLIPEIGRSPRELMQALGSWARGIHPEVWINRARDEIKWRNDRIVVVTDVRHVNEAAALRSFGVEQGRAVAIWRVARPGYGGDSHESETAQVAIREDVTIHNDGDIEALHAHVTRHFHDLLARTA